MLLNFKLILIIFIRFVFGALLEFALVNYASRSDAHRAALTGVGINRRWDAEGNAIEDTLGYAIVSFIRTFFFEH